MSAGPAIFPALTFSTRNGLLIRCPNHPGARVPVYEVFAEDAYRLTGLVAAWGAEPHVLDIGGHIGCFSLQVAHAHRAATVTAYEASPTTASWLSHNVELTVWHTGSRSAVSQWTAEAELLKIMDNGHGSSLTGQTNSSPGEEVTVQAISLAQVLDRAGSVALVKIDTEGAEYDMILQTPHEAWTRVRSVVIEYHNMANHSWTELNTYLQKAGFRLDDLQQAGQSQGTAWLSRS